MGGWESTSRSKLAAELARAHGVRERTAWRWLAAERAGVELPELERRCLACHQPLPAGVTIRRRYCDGACRVFAYRHRRRAGLWPPSRQNRAA